MIWVLGTFLLASNAVWLVVFLRARHLNRKMGLHQKDVQEWLKVHDSLQRSGGVLLAIKRVDPSSVMYREPVR
jgi:hypothetical protein